MRTAEPALKGVNLHKVLAPVVWLLSDGRAACHDSTVAVDGEALYDASGCFYKCSVSLESLVALTIKCTECVTGASHHGSTIGRGGIV